MKVDITHINEPITNNIIILINRVHSVHLVMILSYIKPLRFTLPSTTQQSLIKYRVGALSVASTIISYLTNSHNKKKPQGFSGNTKMEMQKVSTEKCQASRKKKDRSYYRKDTYLLNISKAFEVRKASSCSTISIEELTLNIHSMLVPTTVIRRYKHLRSNKHGDLFLVSS